MTFSIMTFSITTFSITTFSITTFSITTFSITKLSIKGLHVTLSISDTHHNSTLLLCRVSHFIYYYAECHHAVCRYAECRYGECRGAKATSPTLEVCAKSCSIKDGTHLTCGLYYKHVTVVNDTFSGVNK